MSKILISGCGLSWSHQERPTWVNVLRICGADITDLAGPAISNTLILNQLISELHVNDYGYVICQLTAHGKLDVEINESNHYVMQKDSVRNFDYNGYWPSGTSTEHESKRLFYKYLYSPQIEQQDTILKLLHLQKVCEATGTELYVMQGYRMNWTNNLIDKVNMDKDFVIYEHYKAHKLYAHHDFTNNNTVPNKLYQIEIARHINDNFLRWDGMQSKIEKFNA